MSPTETDASSRSAAKGTAASGAAATSAFLTHCLGRIARTVAGSRCVRTATSVEPDMSTPRLGDPESRYAFMSERAHYG